MLSVDGLSASSFDALTSPQRLPVPGHVLIHRLAEHCDTCRAILGSPRLRTTQNQIATTLKKRVRDEDDDEDPYAAHSSIGRWWLFGKRDDRGLGTLVCCVIGAS
ncbi:hypothetical protein ABLO07_02455 [Mycobacterium tuberculosis]